MYVWVYVRICTSVSARVCVYVCVFRHVRVLCSVSEEEGGVTIVIVLQPKRQRPPPMLVTIIWAYMDCDTPPQASMSIESKAEYM